MELVGQYSVPAVLKCTIYKQLSCETPVHRSAAIVENIVYMLGMLAMNEFV